MYNKSLFSVLIVIITITLASVLSANPRTPFHGLLQNTMGEGTAGGQASNNNDDNSSTFLLYENSTYGLKILYPTYWNKEENVGNNSSNSSLTEVVRFSPPFENKNTDKSAENLNVKVDNISDIQPVSLANYTNDTIEDIGKDFKIISLDRNASVGNNNIVAYKLEYTGIEQDVNLKAMIIFSIKDDKAYIITYMAEPLRYSKDLPIIQSMINSIEMKNK
jgi:hypothetical protein